jgi:uncharacterized protein YecE (DUF72 family)
MTKPSKASPEKVAAISPQPVRIGCAGWSIPKEAKAHFGSSGTHLERYSQTFNACEINSSFYRPHRNETWERWARSVPDNFRFSVKAPRAITHDAKLHCSSADLHGFLQQVSFLGDKLGPILFQLPPSLEFGQDCARRFISLLRENYGGDVVLEPRHASWFADPVDELLEEFQIARVAADPPCIAPAAEPGGFAETVYFRLHGSPRTYYSEYSRGFLKALAAQCADLSSKSQVWCVFDNTAAGFAIPNALKLSEMVQKHLGLQNKNRGSSIDDRSSQPRFEAKAI